jgi:hypothetical protein
MATSSSIRTILMAALALWEHCELSRRYIFGATSGDTATDTILGAQRLAPDGLTRTQIGTLFGANILSAQINEALGALEARGKITSYLVPTAGRRAEVWRLVNQPGDG